MRRHAVRAVGSPSAVLFVLALYILYGAAVGLVVGYVSQLLLRKTDLGQIWRRIRGEPLKENGRSLASYGIASVISACGFGLVLRYVARYAFTHFHHPWLLSAWIGGVGTVVLLAFVLITFGLAALLGRWIKRPPLAHFSPPPSLLFFIIKTKSAVFTAFIALTLYCHALLGRPRMNGEARALNTARFGPIIATVSAGLVLWLLSRIGTRLFAKPRISQFLSSKVAWIFAAIIALVPLFPIVLWQWPTLKQLDYRMLAVALTFLFFFVLFLAIGRLSKVKRPAIVAGAIVAISSAGVFWLGEDIAARKPVFAQAGLGSLLATGLQKFGDWDRDGYSAFLGGGDCKPFDPSVHPFAYDVPGDNIDQNCNGHLADNAHPPVWQPAEVPTSVPDQLNVVLITVDALRADHMKCYGYSRDTTPKLDELAGEAIRFARGWAHAPSTRYSVPAILTGRYPSTIAVGRAWWPPNVLPENRLLAEMFHERGYQTAAFLSYYYFNRAWGLDQGFDVYDTHLETLHSMGGDPARTHGTSARELADANINFLSGPHDRPFFLWTHFYDTHFDFETHPDMPESNFGTSEIDRYDGEIRYTDYHIGRLLDALRQSSLWERTVVVVTSDHGDGFGEHGLPPSQRHGYHLYANETQVPLIIRVPGMPAKVIDTVASHVDIAPTLINLLRPPAPAEPQLLGQSLLSWMKGAVPKTDRTIYQEVWYEGPTFRKALVNTRSHLIHNEIPDGTFEFFDRTSDPLEERDLDGRRTPEQAELEKKLAEQVDQLAPLVPSYNRP